MAKSKNTTQPSVIAILARQRAALFQAADADGARALTELEHQQADALATVIAITPASNRRDAAAQVAVAHELLERLQHGVAGPGRLGMAHAALASASRAMAPRKRAA